MVVVLLLDDGDPYLGFVVVPVEGLGLFDDGELYFGLDEERLGVLLLGELYRLPPPLRGGFANVSSETTQVTANKAKSASVKILRYMWDSFRLR